MKSKNERATARRIKTYTAIQMLALSFFDPYQPKVYSYWRREQCYDVGLNVGLSRSHHDCSMYTVAASARPPTVNVHPSTTTNRKTEHKSKLKSLMSETEWTKKQGSERTSRAELRARLAERKRRCEPKSHKWALTRNGKISRLGAGRFGAKPRHCH